MNPEERAVVNLCTASTIIAVVSVFFYGTFLSLAALGCALIAFAKYKKLGEHYPEHRYLDLYKKRVIKALILSVIVLVLNAAAAFFFAPIVEAKYGDALGFFGSQGSTPSSPKGSIWG